eukprot:scaffold30058_cov29-Prasinocladus_malaysianus.AAC.1
MKSIRQRIASLARIQCVASVKTVLQYYHALSPGIAILSHVTMSCHVMSQCGLGGPAPAGAAERRPRRLAVRLGAGHRGLHPAAPAPSLVILHRSRCGRPGGPPSLQNHQSKPV